MLDFGSGHALSPFVNVNASLFSIQYGHASFLCASTRNQSLNMKIIDSPYQNCLHQKILFP